MDMQKMTQKSVSMNSPKFSMCICYVILECYYKDYVINEVDSRFFFNAIVVFSAE